MMKKIQAEQLLGILKDALQYKDKRKEYLSRYEELVGEYDIVDVNQEQLVVLEDLAYDCAFYSVDRKARREDPALIDDEEIEKKIRETFAKGNWNQF